MAPQLLPLDFDTRAADAVRAFWSTRVDAASSAQGGTRGAVISGKTMDGFIDLVRHVAVHCGLPARAVFTDKRAVVLPGYFRATKNWDVLVIHDGQLLGVFEFKSQVGSFGNNFNNRSEEVIGAAADLWVAHHAGAYRHGGEPWMVREPELPLLNPVLQRDPTPPFLGWLMLLEDCEGSRHPVRVDEPHFRAFPEFTGASYARRYQILCERLVERQLYGAAALVLSSPEDGARSGSHSALSEPTSLRRCFSVFAARLAARTG